MSSTKENLKCGFCSKDFSSINALYGHMKAHPDRTWRGMQSPQPQPASSSSSLPSCWSVSARRGRKSTTSAAASSASAVADDLLFLSKSEDQAAAKKKIKKMKEIGNEYLSSDNNNTKLVRLKKLYRCHSCNKEFSSHQALGGHKSSHNKTNKTTTLLDLSQMGPQRRIRMIDFDLNELPPMDDDGGEAFQCL